MCFIIIINESGSGNNFATCFLLEIPLRRFLFK